MFRLVLLSSPRIRSALGAFFGDGKPPSLGRWRPSAKLRRNRLRPGVAGATRAWPPKSEKGLRCVPCTQACPIRQLGFPCVLSHPPLSCLPCLLACPACVLVSLLLAVLAPSAVLQQDVLLVLGFSHSLLGQVSPYWYPGPVPALITAFLAMVKATIMSCALMYSIELFNNLPPQLAPNIGDRETCSD